MGTIQLRRNFARNILIRMLIIAGLAAALVVWKVDFINQVYFREQLTPIGLIINGAIAGLFLVGLARMVSIFIHYAREEGALVRFLRNLREGEKEPLANVRPKSIIALRYRTMKGLYEAHCPISHGSLASTLIASESTRNSLPKFIHNILILTGVFGTLVSLSIALIGASDLLESAISASGMGLVVHGMSTALSTTITAIVCYLYFGYFYLKLTDVQTHLVSAVEQVTTNELLPRFQVQTDSILYEFSGLIRSLQGLVQQMSQSQSVFEGVEQRILNTLDAYRDKTDTLAGEMGNIQRLLRAGFRLNEHE